VTNTTSVARPATSGSIAIRRKDPPEITTLITDDWETNSLTLEFLRLEMGLHRAAEVAGISSEEMLYQVCANPDVSLECKLEHARITRDRGMPGVILIFAAPESHFSL
jgi:hypothetical protein